MQLGRMQIRRNPKTCGIVMPGILRGALLTAERLRAMVVSASPAVTKLCVVT